ncbi:alpha/beta fold hydrolase [Slackia heliotrinireducens]|uniref:alpha/beta fold hydrolase n=1 Tax=Slackia heliotrinireducens TaxID=84110 RepID=UPI003314C9EF
MKASDLTYPSHDGKTTVHAVVWEPDTDEKPLRGVIQIAHGMEEYIERYTEFAGFLVEHGFAVCGNDHVGHGKSVATPESLSHISCSPNGTDTLIEDVHGLRGLMQERFAGVPYVLFGHSMGAFMTQAYLTRHADGLAAAIICGVGFTPPVVSKGGTALVNLLIKLHGETAKSELVDGMVTGAYSKAVKNARTPLDWLSYSEANVDKYIEDPLCGVMFTLGGYKALLGLTSIAADPKAAANIPKTLPVLFIAGAEDPVGDNGEGVMKAVELYQKSGIHVVDVSLYRSMRHEILNEDDHQRVFDDVLTWLTRRGL